MGSNNLRCGKCFGRGFYLKSGGYTSADREKCQRCDGTGEYKEVPLKGTFKGVVTDSWTAPRNPPKKKDSLYRRYGVDC